MSFARFTSDCNVYVYESVDPEQGLVCHNCSLVNPEGQYLVSFGPDGHATLLAHLFDHRAAGDLVPEYVVDGIRRDAAGETGFG